MTQDIDTVNASPALVVRASRDMKPLTEPIMFEEESLPAFLRVALLVICSLVVVFLVWSSFVRLDEIATAAGAVVPSATVKVVQHLEGGVVGEVLVAEGDLVKSNQTLVRLNPAAAQSELDQTIARYVALQLRIERVKAIIEKRIPDFASIGQNYPELVADQRRLWEGQLTVAQSGLEVIDSQIAQKQKEMAQLSGQLAIAQRQVSITHDQLEIRRQGVSGGVVSRQTYLETELASVTAEGEVTRLQRQIEVTSDSLQEYERRRRNLGDTQTQDALTELGAASAEMEQVKSTLGKLRDRVERVEIKAPVDGIVQDLKIHTPGEVLPAGGIVTRIVPTDGSVEAEVHISPADIGHVQVGQPVKVKVASYEYVRYGQLTGTLARISATTFSDEQGKPYYKGVVHMDRAYMGPQPGANPILLGMSVEADVVVGNKTLIQYLLKPIFVSLKNSFHER